MADPVGLNTLKRFYRDQYCRQMRDTTQEYYPNRNDFSIMQHYYLQRSVINAISQVRDDRGLIPLETRQILLDALIYNDNTSNEVRIKLIS